MNEKIENEELRPYVYAYIIKKLESCDLFVKTFGKNFAKKRLDLNFSNLYTNEKKRNIAGYYSSDDLSITLCKTGKDGKMLSIEDLETDSDLRQTILHEGVHSVLRVIKLDCTKRKIKSGTGILEFYENNTELGRGLNEGLTNWICEKSGLTTQSYPILTNFVKQIELGIGPRKTMQLAKGDIKKNVSKNLGMDERRCREFLGLADEIYTLGRQKDDLNFIISTLSMELHEDGTYMLFNESLEEDMDAVRKLPMFANVESNSDYLAYAYWHQKDHRKLETKLAYFKEIRTNINTKIKNTRGEIESKIFTKYFKRDFIEMKSMPKILDSDYKKYLKLSNLMQEYEDDDSKSAAWFKSEMKNIKVRYFKEISERLTEEIKTGKFSMAKFMEYKNLFKSGDSEIDIGNQEFNMLFAETLFPERFSELIGLMMKLEYDDKLEDLDKYSILEIGEGDTRRILYLKDNKEMYAVNGAGSISMLAEDKIEDPNMLFDFTLVDGQFIQEVVTKFLVLKEKIFEHDPKAEIRIVNDVIMITSNEKTAYVVINGNELVGVNKQKEDSLKDKFSPERFSLNSYLPQVNDESALSKFFLKIKRRLLLKNSDSIYHSEKYVPKRLKQNDENDFEKRLRDMSNYSELPKTEKNMEEKQSREEKDEFYR